MPKRKIKNVFDGGFLLLICDHLLDGDGVEIGVGWPVEGHDGLRRGRLLHERHGAWRAHVVVDASHQVVVAVFDIFDLISGIRLALKEFYFVVLWWRCQE